MAMPTGRNTWGREKGKGRRERDRRREVSFKEDTLQCGKVKHSRQ
jgi:hypothetical protein